MEIDFLGLISKHSSTTQHKKEQHKSSNSITDSGDEISLSLSTCSTPDCQKDFHENTWRFHGEQILPSCSSSNSTTFCSLAYNLENGPRTEQPYNGVASTGPFPHPYSNTGLQYGLNAKNLPEHPVSPATVTSLYSRCPNVTKDTLLIKAKNSMHTAGKSSMRSPSDGLTRDGYTPTVAMARKATLARFLEKRSHRLTSKKKTFLMGKLLDTASSDASNTNYTSCSKITKHRGRSR